MKIVEPIAQRIDEVRPSHDRLRVAAVHIVPGIDGMVAKFSRPSRQNRHVPSVPPSHEIPTGFRS